nr:hypothetical protein [Allomuricauda sp.]
MEIKIFVLTFLCAPLLLFNSCGNHKFDQNTTVPEHFGHGRDLVNLLDSFFLELHHLDERNADFEESVIVLNEKIGKTMERVKSPRLLQEVHKSFLNQNHDFVFSLSEDQKLAVFSWHTRLQDKHRGIKNIAFYVRGNKVVPTTLYNDALLFHNVYKVSVGRKPIYLMHGQTNTGSDSKYRLDAYYISADGLEQATVFPNRKNTLSVVQCDFEIEKDASLIHIPEIWGNSTIYRPIALSLRFGKQVYQETSYPFPKILEENDFSPQNALGFINGSELPNSGENNKFLFDDHVKVEMKHQDDSSSAAISIYKADELEIPFGQQASFVGKKNESLFFLESNDGEAGLLHLYDLNKRKMRWSRPMDKFMLYGDALLFAEKIESWQVPYNKKVNCSSEFGIDKGFFKVYTLPYQSHSPIVDFTNQIFCGSQNRLALAQN